MLDRARLFRLAWSMARSAALAHRTRPRAEFGPALRKAWATLKESADRQRALTATIRAMIAEGKPKPVAGLSPAFLAAAQRGRRREQSRVTAYYGAAH